jgi:hypothetical protein
MSRSAASARATIDAWREQHADRLDPIRFHFMDALERRAASHGGEARRILDDRLSGLLDAYASDLADMAKRVGIVDKSTMPCAPAPGPLGGLVARIAGNAAIQGDGHIAEDVAPRPSSLPELAALDTFRKTWSRVRSESQLRQSLEHVPANAGPLNSSALVHRSIALMRELSPGYLQRFLSYVDDLSWMETVVGSTTPAVRDAPRAARLKRTRNKPHP